MCGFDLKCIMSEICMRLLAIIEMLQVSLIQCLDQGGGST